jgi:hypothetical protein
VNQDRAELIAFVEQARKGRLEYYPSVLAETLLRELQAAR